MTTPSHKVEGGRWESTSAGVFCPVCASLVAPATPFAPEVEGGCDQCGYPDPDEVADYHGMDDADQSECWNCAGEGFVSDCWEEWACVDPESGCDLCTRRCDVCRPTPTPKGTPHA